MVIHRASSSDTESGRITGSYQAIRWIGMLNPGRTSLRRLGNWITQRLGSTLSIGITRYSSSFPSPTNTSTSPSMSRFSTRSPAFPDLHKRTSLWSSRLEYLTILDQVQDQRRHSCIITGPGGHHLAFQTVDIEETYQALMDNGQEFPIDLVGSPGEGLKQTLTEPLPSTLLVNEYIHRYGDFDGFFTKSNVTPLTEATGRQ